MNDFDPPAPVTGDRAAPSPYASLHPALQDAVVILQANYGAEMPIDARIFVDRCLEYGAQLTDTPAKERAELDKAARLCAPFAKPQPTLKRREGLAAALHKLGLD